MLEALFSLFAGYGMRWFPAASYDGGHHWLQYHKEPLQQMNGMHSNVADSISGVWINLLFFCSRLEIVLFGSVARMDPRTCLFEMVWEGCTLFEVQLILLKFSGHVSFQCNCVGWNFTLVGQIVYGRTTEMHKRIN